MISLRKLRRWGVGWKNILKCYLGFHGKRTWQLDGKTLCSRCGTEL